MSERTDDFMTRWGAFLGTIFDPWALVLAITTVSSGMSAVKTTPAVASGLLTLLTSISAGLLGGRIAQRWAALVDESVIAARGKSAVRGLKLQLVGAADLERRTRLFLQRCEAPTGTGVSNGFSVPMALEEVVDRCRLLEEQLLSSIEDWTDIVPEADIKTKIGEITKLASQIDQLSGDILATRKELDDAKVESAFERQKLKDELERKEKVLRETKNELATRRAEFPVLSYNPSASAAVLTGLTIPLFPNVTLGEKGLTVTGLPLRQDSCSRCGKSYSDPPGVIRVGNLCDWCAKSV